MKTLIFTFFMVLTLAGFAQVNELDANGKKHGKWTRYFEDDQGKIRYSGQFDHGVPVGVFTYYHPNQQVSILSSFRGKTGVCFSKHFSDTKQLESEGIYKNQVKDSVWTYYGLEEQLLSTESYKDGKLDGDVIVYYHDGRLAEKTHYIDGVKNGEWIQKYSDGKNKFIGTYVNGKLNGEATYYNSDGRPSYKGSYLNGLRHGRWLKIENGEVVLIETFYRGSLRKSEEK